MADTIAFSADTFSVATKKGVLGANNTQTVTLKEQMAGDDRQFSRVYVNKYGIVTGGMFAEDAGLPDDPEFGGHMGMRVPSGTSDQRPTNGLAVIRYNTELKAFEVNENGSWVRPFQASNLKSVESDILPAVQSSEVFQVNIGSEDAPFQSGVFWRVNIKSKAVLADADRAADALVNLNGTLYWGGAAVKAGQNYNLPIATPTILGGVKVGSRLSITEEGLLSADKTKVADLYGSVTGDLIGSITEPFVREITGVAASLTKSKSSFLWRDAGTWASGAGISYGYGYVNGVRTRCWMANSQRGELYATYDEWKTVVVAPLGNTYHGTYTDTNGHVYDYSDLNATTLNVRYAGAYYTAMPGSSSMWWIFTGQGRLFGIEDIPGNYHSTGALRIESMFEFTLSSSLDPNSLVVKGSGASAVLVMVGNQSDAYYVEAADINWTTKTITAHSVNKFYDTDGITEVSVGVLGGCACDGTVIRTVGRDTGVVLESTNGKDWSIAKVVSVRFQDGSNMLRGSTHEYTFALPMNTVADADPSWGNNQNVCWGGMTWAKDCWIVVNGKTAPATASQYWSPFLYSYDGINWNAYKPTTDEMETNYSYSCYKIAYGNNRIYATNSNPTQYATEEPAVYRLIVDEVPVHRNMLLEKDLQVLGNLTFDKLKGADYVSANDEGLLTGHTLPANATVLGTDSNRNIVQKQVTIPNITVSTSDPTGTPADGDLWLKVSA